MSTSSTSADKDKKHQQKLPETPPETDRKKVPEHVMARLKQFDLDIEFGPCTGVTRQERYDRAISLGKQPDPHIESWLQQYGHGINQHLWHNEL